MREWSTITSNNHPIPPFPSIRALLSTSKFWCVKRSQLSTPVDLRFPSVCRHISWLLPDEWPSERCWQVGEGGPNRATKPLGLLRGVMFSTIVGCIILCIYDYICIYTHCVLYVKHIISSCMFSYKHIILQNTKYFANIHIYVIYVLYIHTHTTRIGGENCEPLRWF